MRSTTTLALGLVAGTALVITAPLTASAHVGVSPDELVVGDHSVLTFSFSHGCDDSPTTSLRITMPEGLTSVAPTMDGDWTVAVERGDDGLISAVTYTAVTPVPIDLRGAVSMAVGIDEETPDTLAFPVLQTCVDGSTDWSQLTEKGEDPHSLEAPAPVVSVSPATEAGHGGSEKPHAEEKPTADEKSAPAADPAGAVLGAGGLVAGLAALVVSVLAYRRRA